MGRIYCIGKFQFDSYKEYQEAMDDIDKIREISKKMDINETGVAERLYTLIREGKINFRSEAVGNDYLLYLSDMMVEDYKSLSRTSVTTRLANRLQQLSPGQVVGTICMAGAIVCFLIFFGSEYHDQQKIREMERIKSEQDISAASDWLSAKVIKALGMGGDEEVTEENEDAVLTVQTATVENEVHSAGLGEKAPEILPQFQKLYQQNSDFSGWITIVGTGIDYPLMQPVPENSDFYLDHDYKGEEDINGSIFLDARNDIQSQDDNLIVYGHNMKSGMMFGGLEQYLDAAYWKEHKTVTLQTLYDQAEYEIIAVCLSKVAAGGENDFQYYDFINAGSEEAFQLYVKRLQGMNVMGGKLDISYGDKLLTLSTCSNYTQDGRLFLVAKKVS